MTIRYGDGAPRSPFDEKDPKKRDEHTQRELVQLRSDAARIAEKFFDGLLGHGYSMTFLEMIEEAVIDEMRRMRKEVARRRFG